MPKPAFDDPWNETVLNRFDSASWEETVLYAAQGGDPCGVSTPSSGLSPKAMLYSAQRNGDGSYPMGGVVFVNGSDRIQSV